MATLPSQIMATGVSFSSFACLFSHQSRRRSTAGGRTRLCSVRPVVMCRGNADDDHLRCPEGVERRDVLLGGLGGLAGLGLNKTAAVADPIAPPDLSKCHAATVPATGTTPKRNVECCPPFTDEMPKSFTPPSFSKLKVRPAAHLVDQEYVEKFETAIRLMKNLDGDDPCNFYQQAQVHCAYCNEAYDQVLTDGDERTLTLQVHSCWLFLPWHRMYLHFFERILASLINDDSFALPYWNWDHPDGMEMPAIYTNQKSSLYNPNRNQNHLPPNTIILDYSATDPDLADRQRQIRDNLSLMHSTMITNGKIPELFMGARYCQGSPSSPGPGSLERSPHNNIHVWTGNPKNRYGEDMGNFYSAGRDCLFYAHHANVDRMWTVWNNVLEKKNFPDPDFLGASFLFYDENRQLVKVKVSDFLDNEKLGYKYQDQELLWTTTVPSRTSFLTADQIKEQAAKTAAVFPLTLFSTVSTTVKRPKKSRSDKEKAAAEEVLVIRDIDLPPNIFAKFDVFINAPDVSGLTPSSAEFAGSFSNVPHKKKEDATDIKPIKTNLTLALTDLLKVIGADGDDSIVVTLVPRKGEGKIKIGAVEITYIKI